MEEIDSSGQNLVFSSIGQNGMIIYYFTFLWLEIWAGLSWSVLLQVSFGPDGWFRMSLNHMFGD